MPETRLFVRLYRWLLRLYPAGFRQNYAAPMERQFRDDLAETHSARAVAALWIRLFIDATRSLPLQLSRELRQDARHALR